MDFKTFLSPDCYDIKSILSFSLVHMFCFIRTKQKVSSALSCAVLPAYVATKHFCSKLKSSASEVRRREIQTPGKAITDPSAEPRRRVNIYVDVL